MRSDITKDDLVNLNGSRYADPVFRWNPSLGVTDIEFKSQNFGIAYKNNIFVCDINNGNIYYLKLNETRNDLVFHDPDIGSDLVAEGYEKESLIWAKRFKGITDI